MKVSEMFSMECKKEMFEEYKSIREVMGISSNFEDFCKGLDRWSINTILKLFQATINKQK